VTEDRIERLRAALIEYVRSGESETGFLAEDFVLYQSASITGTAGVFRGRSALRQSREELEEALEGIRYWPQEFLLAPGGEVVVLVHARARGRASGVETDNHIAWVWTFEGDLATRMVIYENQAEALAAVGLAGEAADG